MSVLSSLIPSNLLEEKEKFFANTNYNPQFIYSNPFDDDIFIRFTTLQPKFVELARESVEKAYFGRNELDLWMMEGKVLKQEEVTKLTQHFLDLHQLADKISIVWSSSFISRASITSTNIKY